MYIDIYNKYYTERTLSMTSYILNEIIRECRLSAESYLVSIIAARCICPQTNLNCCFYIWIVLFLLLLYSNRTNKT